VKILHIHSTDSAVSGGAIVMLRLHYCLKDYGYDSKILCSNKRLESEDSIRIKRWWKLENKIKKVTSRLGLNDIHCVSSFKIRKNKAYENADILHIHGIHGGFFSYLALSSLTENKPGVFTLHDVWGFTGHCAINYDCDRWRIGCGKCPYLDAPPAVRRDNTRLEWKLKNWVYRRSNLTIVCPSKNITNQAKQSMLNRFPIHHIPHGVNTEVYRPLDPAMCRHLLGIPPGKKVVIFASAGLHWYNKGGDLLVKALHRLPEALKAETVLLLLGDKGEEIARSTGLQTLKLGFVSSDRLKAICYSAADLCISPTRAESFGLVGLESIASGTPVVSFRVGGVPDTIRHGITGYLAEPENSKDFSNRIVELLEDERLRDLLSQQGQSIAKKEFSLDLQVQRHIELYQQVLGV
jgi:glycosyltransferase involved in cell wall biosynthesis